MVWLMSKVGGTTREVVGMPILLAVREIVMAKKRYSRSVIP